MTKQETMITLMLLWSVWFFFIGGWAVLRFLYGLYIGEGKWRGFKHFLITFVPLIVYTVYSASQYMGDV